MTVGGSVTLTSATPTPSGVTSNLLVTKEEGAEHCSKKCFLLPFSHSPLNNQLVDEKGKTEEESEEIFYSRTHVVVISIGRC